MWPARSPWIRRDAAPLMGGGRPIPALDPSQVRARPAAPGGGLLTAGPRGREGERWGAAERTGEDLPGPRARRAPAAPGGPHTPPLSPG
ncbi:hypothetical protein AAFF_G00304740 [Aldrovandia affinis]|uniref:Uncharacterized protein n=1 Tax=Aldrovandia affinis TaxID=143900 RepID=A0AAD7WRE9_9TELE|nr:hypothetical protein AAFF_G00304740 [Aldrovandia affinis]